MSTAALLSEPQHCTDQIDAGVISSEFRWMFFAGAEGKITIRFARSPRCPLIFVRPQTGRLLSAFRSALGGGRERIFKKVKGNSRANDVINFSECSIFNIKSAVSQHLVGEIPLQETRKSSYLKAASLRCPSVVWRSH